MTQITTTVGTQTLDLHTERALGFWFYIISDSIIFAVLFANYGVLRNGVADGPDPHSLFTMWRVIAETGFLLLSSLTFGFLSISAISGKKGSALFWLLITILLGLSFISLEFGEFSEMARQGATPQVSGFLSAFYILVGTHGLHVSIGLIMLIVLAIQIITKGLTVPVLSRLYRIGLFWHFLDIIWVGIFSFVYLPGLMQ